MTPAARSVRVSVLTALVMLCCACAPTGRAMGSGAAPADRVVWSGDAAAGDLSQFQDTPWNTVPGGLPPDVVSSPTRSGHYSIRARIAGKGGTGEGICCGSRSELVPKLADIHPGDDLWFSFSTLLGQGFPVDAEWQTITQWRQDPDGSPPLELSVQDGQYSLSGGYGHPVEPMAFAKSLGPAVPDTWEDWLIHITFSPDPAVGYVDVWQNGRLLVDGFHPQSGTMYPTTEGEPDVYLKVGYYRNAAIRASGTVYYADWKVGTTRAAVDE